MRLLAATALAVTLAVSGACSDDAIESSDESTTTTTAAAATGEPAGSVDETVPTSSVPLPEAVGLDQPAELGEALTAAVTSVQAGQSEATLPGEVAGPSVTVTVALRNVSPTPVDVSSVTVDLRDAQDLPAYQVTTPPAEPFTGTISPGAEATATYVFTIDPAQRAGARLIITHATDDVDTVVFTGDLPNA